MRVPSALGAAGQELCLVNAPIRAVRCSLWDASEMCWRHKPQHYAAIHFNEDAIFDFDWETSFSFKLPQSIPSGIYVMRISSGKHEDAMPFFCLPSKRNASGQAVCAGLHLYIYNLWETMRVRIIRHLGRIALSPMEPIPIIQRLHPEYGLSTYNIFRDGSGICHASCKRPLFNLRPGYITLEQLTVLDCAIFRLTVISSHGCITRI